jgi:hypothetical protein
MEWMSILTRKIQNKITIITTKLIIKINANGYDEAMKQIKQDPLLQQGWKIYTIIKNVYRQ